MNFAISILGISLFLSCGMAPDLSEQPEESSQKVEEIKPGIYDFEELLSQIGDAGVAVVTNHTGVIGNVHIVDSLISSGVTVKKVFAPEHGFRGDRPDGENIEDGIDRKTGVRVVSLYGKNKKPSKESLKDVDLVLFDIQDVGARFYTYLSTLHYVMQACSEQSIPLIVADRPNPNIHYIDGPVMNAEFNSFIGLHPVPIVYGMTIGEYALMLNGEGWHKAEACDLTVFPCLNYERSMSYELPIKPSPNLPTMESVYLYPSICLFEGTKVSVGRGTSEPFTIIGEPGNKSGDFEFIPEPKVGASINPKHDGVTCRGYDLSDFVSKPAEISQLDFTWLVRMYAETDDKSDFFLKSGYFDKLAGTDKLRKEIIDEVDLEEIRNGWQSDLKKFEAIRSKYLIYAE
ncbi:MAG: DUF1343 domain-containing protein [Cryomorphaceae bacterium]